MSLEQKKEDSRKKKEARQKKRELALVKKEEALKKKEAFFKRKIDALKKNPRVKVGKRRLPKQPVASTSGTSSNPKRARYESHSDSDEEWPCLVCCEPFADSKPGEPWVQCNMCKRWEHEECTPGHPLYICHNCDSDSE